MAVMHSAFTYPFGTSRSTQRRHVLLLVVALCLWMLASATHIHTGDDHGAPGKPPVTCSVCLSLSAGAAPPMQHALPALVRVVSVVDASYAPPLPASNVPSFYLSRAPPAA